jgi:hypothetical protein
MFFIFCEFTVKFQKILDEANEIPDERLETSVPEWSKKKRRADKRTKSLKKQLRNKSNYD